MAIALLLSSIFAAPSADFDNDIIPILTKAGCNTAACHGSAAGRGEFKLSLYGGDPARDYDAIVRQHQGRRINHRRPVASLLLAKPTGELEHGGDVRLDADGSHVAAIETWIEQGAERNVGDVKLARLEVLPTDAVLAKTSESVQLQATAIYCDGTRREVNDLAVFSADDDAAVKVSGGGKATLLRRGRHTISIRFLNEVAAVTVTVPLGDRTIDLSQAPRRNFIDDEIYATLQQLRLEPSPQAERATMLRRLRLDLTGRLPTAEEVTESRTESAATFPKGRIDALLGSKEFDSYWAHVVGNWLRVGPRGSDLTNAESYHNWLARQLKARRPLNEIAAALVTADGASGPANFYRAAPDARGQAEHFSEVLMGVRLRCANCHNHPLDRWTQDDYHGLAAIFAPLERGASIRYIGRGKVAHPAKGETAVAKLPSAEFLPENRDHRPALSNWLTAEDNQYFARSMVNRIWAELMGRGLVEPVDDFRATNPASHPGLLEKLADDFIANDYDLRHTVGLIVTSAAYARSSAETKANSDDTRFYSHALRKPLPAEVLLDAMSDATGVKLLSVANGQRAIDLPGPARQSPALELLGQCDRQTSCGVGGSAGGNLSRQLALINGDLINKALGRKENRLTGLLESTKDNDQVVAELYTTTLSRMPTEAEAAFWKTKLNGRSEALRREQLEDMLWALLNCDEFVKRY